MLTHLQRRLMCRLRLLICRLQLREAVSFSVGVFFGKQKRKHRPSTVRFFQTPLLNYVSHTLGVAVGRTKISRRHTQTNEYHTSSLSRGICKGTRSAQGGAKIAAVARHILCNYPTHDSYEFGLNISCNLAFSCIFPHSDHSEKHRFYLISN